MSDMRYMPNRRARSLAGRRSESVGLVVTEPREPLLADPFFPLLLANLTEALAEAEQQLVLFMPHGARDEARLRSYLASKPVDAAIVLSYAEDRLMNELIRQEFPVVACGRPLTDIPVTYVDMDNEDAADRAVGHLREQGCESIGIIAGPQETSTGFDRLAGARRALGALPDQEFDSRVRVGDFGHQSGYEAARSLLASAPGLDGLFVASDRMLFGAMAALREAGRSVPGDVAVVGFDDYPACAEFTPPLSSVRVPMRELAAELVRQAAELHAAGNRTPRKIVLSTELVVRQSSLR